MGVFDDFAKKNGFIGWLVVATGCVGLLLLVVTQLTTVRNWFLISDTYYGVQLELHPTHLMYGRIGDPVILETPEDSNFDDAEAVAWTIAQMEQAAESRMFAASGVEDFYLSIEQNWLVVSSPQSDWTVYLYAIARYEQELYQASPYAGIHGDALRRFGQLARTKHVLDSNGETRLNLDDYFEDTDAVLNAEDFASEDRLTLTFHGSNGQFRGELLEVKVTDDGTYSFVDGEMARSVTVNIRPAQIAMLREDQESAAVSKFRTDVTRNIVANDLLGMSIETIEDFDGLNRLAERMRRAEINDLRERLLDENAVDYVVRVNMVETQIQRFIHWNDVF